METSPLYQAKLEIGDLIRLSLGEPEGESHFAVGYLRYPVKNNWLNPGHLNLILSQIDPFHNSNVRKHLQGRVSRYLSLVSEGILSLSVNGLAQASVLRSGIEPYKDMQRKVDDPRYFPLTGVNIGDIVLLSDRELQVAGQVHEIGRNHLLLGYRFPDEEPIWLRKYDLSRFSNYQNLSSELK